MTTFSSKPIITLSDLFNEPVNKTIGSFNYLASSYGLEPFKMVTFKNPVLISRFKLPGSPVRPLHENYFLSVLLVKTSISLEEVNDFVIDLASTKQLSHSVLTIYKNVLQTNTISGCHTGKDWAVKQTRLGLRLLMSIAGEAGIEATRIENYDRNAFSSVLGLDANKWTIFSALVLQAKIKITPDSLMDSIYGLN
jgi:nitroreductase/dihydropteridine reductase